MARYYDEIGFRDTQEIKPGIWSPIITTRKYSGDILKNFKKTSDDNKVNEDVSISNMISIIADDEAFLNTHNIAYAKYLGVKWKVSTIEVIPPRLILFLGGVYSENS